MIFLCKALQPLQARTISRLAYQNRLLFIQLDFRYSVALELFADACALWSIYRWQRDFFYLTLFKLGFLGLLRTGGGGRIFSSPHLTSVLVIQSLWNFAWTLRITKYLYMQKIWSDDVIFDICWHFKFWRNSDWFSQYFIKIFLNFVYLSKRWHILRWLFDVCS